MGWRRFIPGKRKNRREDRVIQAIPISDAGPLLHEDDTDPDTSSQYHNQQPHGHALGEPNLNIDYGRFQEGVAHPPGFGLPPPPSHDTAVPVTQHSQQYGERAITNVDYDGAQAVGSENFIPPPPSSVSRSHSRHHRGSRPSSKVPGITVHAPSIMSGGGHMRSGSPDPLPVPPPQHKNGYRDDRALYSQPERHRSQRRRDHDRSHGYAPRGEPTDFPGEHGSRLIARNPDSPQHPDFQFSKCTGRKKALCIGINYTGQNSQLDGCVNDAKNMYRFLMDRLSFRSRDIIRLTDDARDPRNLPTRSNILGAMRWLVQDAHKHDSLFIHYSGHGSRVRDLNGDEVDGYDEVIFPLDYAQTGTILDDELHDTLIKHLPSGCRLTAVFDSCHSGSILDLLFNYHSNGQVRSSSITGQFLAEKSTPAEVICWSGSTDAGTSADVHEGGGIAVGAMSYAFLSALSNNKSRLSFEDVLRDLRRATRKYHQKPQLSASHHIDLNRRFLI